MSTPDKVTSYVRILAYNEFNGFWPVLVHAKSVALNVLSIQ